MKSVRSRSIVVAVLVGAVGIPASTAGNASAGAIPGQFFTYQGLRVALPGLSKETPIDASGLGLGVQVMPRGKQPKSRPTARLTITRAASGGEKAATLADKRGVRKGEVRIVISKRIGVKYRLQVQIGKRRWISRLRTVEPGTIPQPDASPSSAPCQPAGKITADVTTVAAGGTLPFHISNTGNATLTYGSGNGWTQLVNGVWSNVLSPGGLGQATTSTIAPGETKTGIGAVWPTLTPGIYSMTVVATCSTTNAKGVATFKAIPLQTVPVTVTPAAGR